MTAGVAKAIQEGRDELTAEEAREYVEAQVRDRLGMSLAEFYRRASAGDLPEDPSVPHLVLLAGADSSGC